jgi:hypothetical protein
VNCLLFGPAAWSLCLLAEQMTFGLKCIFHLTVINALRGQCRLFIQLPAARATERCAEIAVKNATGELAQGGRFLAAVLKARNEPEKISFAAL